MFQDILTGLVLMLIDKLIDKLICRRTKKR